MNFSRFTNANWGGIAKLYFLKAASADTIQSNMDANNGKANTATLAANAFLIEVEPETAQFTFQSKPSDHGDFTDFGLQAKLGGLKPYQKNFYKYWISNRLAVYIIDLEENHHLIGSAAEPLRFSGKISANPKTTLGTFLNIKVMGQLRSI